MNLPSLSVSPRPDTQRAGRGQGNLDASSIPRKFDASSFRYCSLTNRTSNRLFLRKDSASSSEIDFGTQGRPLRAAAFPSAMFSPTAMPCRTPRTYMSHSFLWGPSHIRLSWSAVNPGVLPDPEKASEVASRAPKIATSIPFRMLGHLFTRLWRTLNGPLPRSQGGFR